MSFWKALFGGADKNPEESRQDDAERKFDLFKYDGVKAMRMNKADYAVRCFTEALALKDDVETRDLLSQTLVSMGRYDEAIAALDHIRRQHPQIAAVYNRMGHIAYMNEDYDRLDEIARQAMEQTPTNAHAYYMAAQVALARRNPVEAVAKLTQAIGIDESDAEARKLRAKADLKWLADAGYADEEVSLLVGQLEAKVGRADEAIKVFTRMIDDNPFQADAYRERATVRLAQGDKEGAEADMRQYAELRPEQMQGADGAKQPESVEEMMQRAYTAINPFGI